VIALVRVDNRLLHGQVLETWIPRLGIREVVVADDEAASSDLACAAMTLCAPPDLSVRVGPVEALRPAELAASKVPVLLLLREVAALARAAARGLTPALAPRVNVGNVHFAPGRRPVMPSVFLSADEVAALKALSAAGFAVEVRAIPSEAPAGMDEIERRYAASR
jgi:mannose/fructose/N-acetylgalactosamine-specific phosphotransferase system component IIB